jgi:hypothetical protein
MFSHRSYDLSTSFAILQASMYLQLSSLYDEIQARIVQEIDVDNVLDEYHVFWSLRWLKALSFLVPALSNGQPLVHLRNQKGVFCRLLGLIYIDFPRLESIRQFRIPASGICWVCAQSTLHPAFYLQALV